MYTKNFGLNKLPFENVPDPLFFFDQGDHARIYLSDLMGDYSKVTQHVENYKATIEALEETNAQLLSAKANSVMQKFTILAFLTFPLFLFTALVEIQFISDYIAGSPARFWTIFVGVGIIVVILVAWFRKKGWL